VTPPSQISVTLNNGNQLDDAQIAALIDHTRDWWTPEQQSEQEATTRQECG
jgi:hypothetical protein